MSCNVSDTAVKMCRFFTAFLNEAGFNFVKKCIELVETRGIPTP